MLTHAKHGGMTILGPVLAAAGLDTLLHSLNSILGAYTGLTGAIVGTCGVIWWVKKLKRKDFSDENGNQPSLPKK